MLMIGDVFATVAILVGACASMWALVMAVSFLMPARAERAQGVIEQGPWKCLGLGFLTVATLGVASIGLLSAPIPGLKLLGTMLYLSLLGTASVGMSGLVLIIARRVRALEPSVSPYIALSRGAAMIVVGGLVPLLGWFLFAPVVLIVSLGAGARALLARSSQPVAQSF